MKATAAGGLHHVGIIDIFGSGGRAWSQIRGFRKALEIKGKNLRENRL
ncbi:hypothetical protein [Rhodobacter capsulatus]|nr:hypothetical protein [Rhodobacter capsulatus]